MTTSAPITLICPECRKENEAERIFCHECGARLDRSALSARKLPKAEGPEQARKRLQSMFNQRGAKIRLWFFRVAKVILGALGVAALVQALMSPEVPPEPKKPMLAASINMDLENMNMYRRPPALRYPEEEVNAFIAGALKTKKAQLNHPLIDFRRALVMFSPGNCKVAIERSILGFPIYTTGVYSVQVADGKLAVAPKAGSIGRLAIKPELMKYAAPLFADVVGAMQRERRLLERVGSIELRDKEIAFTAPQ
jgi:hypothetical protein